MQRLTDRAKNRCAYLVNVKEDEQEVDSPYKNTLQCILDCINRLAAYEDSGATPEQCAHWAQLDREQRLVELPCKVGSEAYRLDDDNEISEVTIIGFGTTTTKTQGTMIECYFVDGKTTRVFLKPFGTVVFLTPEAANAAMEGNHEND